MDERTNPCLFEVLVDIPLHLGILCFSMDEPPPLAEDMLFEAVQSFPPVAELPVFSICLPESEYVCKHSLTPNIEEGTIDANVDGAQLPKGVSPNPMFFIAELPPQVILSL
jgi:hypothetical protein